MCVCVCVCKFCWGGRFLKNHGLVESASSGVEKLVGILPLHFNGHTVFAVVCILCLRFLIYYRTVVLSHWIMRLTCESHGPGPALIVIVIRPQGTHTMCTRVSQKNNLDTALFFLKPSTAYFTGPQRHERLWIDVKLYSVQQEHPQPPPTAWITPACDGSNSVKSTDVWIGRAFR